MEDGDESLDKPQVEGSAPASPEAPGSPDDAAGSPPGSPPASPPQGSGPASPIASPRDSTSAPGSPEAVEKPQMDEEGLEKPAPSSPGGSPVRFVVVVVVYYVKWCCCSQKDLLFMVENVVGRAVQNSFSNFEKKDFEKDFEEKTTIK